SIRAGSLSSWVRDRDLYRAGRRDGCRRDRDGQLTATHESGVRALRGAIPVHDGCTHEVVAIHCQRECSTTRRCAGGVELGNRRFRAGGWWSSRLRAVTATKGQCRQGQNNGDFRGSSSHHDGPPMWDDRWVDFRKAQTTECQEDVTGPSILC